MDLRWHFHVDADVDCGDSDDGRRGRQCCSCGVERVAGADCGTGEQKLMNRKVLATHVGDHLHRFVHAADGATKSIPDLLSMSSDSRRQWWMSHNENHGMRGHWPSIERFLSGVIGRYDHLFRKGVVRKPKAALEVKQ